MRLLSRQENQEHANVWPAVTDSILLIASIFIVLSVVSMVSVAKKLKDFEFQKSGHEGTVCVAYAIPEEHLFPSGKSQFSDPASAKATINKILKNVAERRKEIVAAAQEEFGPSQFYLVLEAAGHTDDTWNESGERTTRNENWKLSAERSYETIKVVEDLVRSDSTLREGLNADFDAYAQPEKTIFRASGYCYSLPRQPIYDETGRKLTGRSLTEARKTNRRVELRLFAQPIKVVHLRKVDEEQ